MRTRMMLAAALLLGAGSASQAALISHWNLNEPSGSTTVADSAGTEDATGTGTLGVPGPLPGSVTAVSLSGSSGSGFRAAGNAAYASSAFSVSFWVNPGTQPGGIGTAVSNRTGENGWIFYLWDLNNTIQFWTKGPGGSGNWNQMNRPALFDGSTWYHVVGTQSDGPGLARALYVTPVAGVTSTATGSLGGAYVAAALPPVGLGHRPDSPAGSLPMAGLLDDVQIYDFAITPGQVQWLLDNPGRALPEPGTLSLLALGGLGLLRRRRRRRRA